MYESSQFNVRTYVQDKQMHHFSQIHKEQIVVFCFSNPTFSISKLLRREAGEGRGKKATVVRFSECAGRPCELSIKLFWMSSGPD
jgi:5,10-methylene-tetrahydrofolate dehydrogenase/methenyl tetrahydrofolate cyclohydrolase